MYFFNMFIRPQIGTRLKDPEVPGFDANNLDIIPAYEVPLKKLDTYVKEHNRKEEEWIKNRQIEIRQELTKENPEVPTKKTEDLEFELARITKKLKFMAVKKELEALNNSWDTWAELTIWKYFFAAGGTFEGVKDAPDVEKMDMTQKAIAAFSLLTDKLIEASKSLDPSQIIKGDGESSDDESSDDESSDDESSDEPSDEPSDDEKPILQKKYNSESDSDIEPINEACECD